ncbi:MAG: hypothetical protein HYV77_01425 [Candidatus Wildermuthbacteria bacterium]|nr:hypothetical protein [Candidatus Wildermuthbacteria bacterium]
MAKKKIEQTLLTTPRLERLLNQQTTVILNAVDEKLAANRISILADVDERLAAMEERFNRKLDKLTTTLDKFLKRMTDMEDEFEIMKNDLNRMKRVIKKKLGVDLS